MAWNGNFYGTSNPPDGSSDYDNLVYSMTPSGTVHTRLMVCPNQICPTNAGPSGTLLQASGGFLIGPGPGGANGVGAIYKMTPLGTPAVLYSIVCGQRLPRWHQHVSLRLDHRESSGHDPGRHTLDHRQLSNPFLAIAPLPILAAHQERQRWETSHSEYSGGNRP